MDVINNLCARLLFGNRKDIESKLGQNRGTRPAQNCLNPSLFVGGLADYFPHNSFTSVKLIAQSWRQDAILKQGWYHRIEFYWNSTSKTFQLSRRSQSILPSANYWLTPSKLTLAGVKFAPGTKKLDYRNLLDSAIFSSFALFSKKPANFLHHTPKLCENSSPSILHRQLCVIGVHPDKKWDGCVPHHVTPCHALDHGIGKDWTG